MSATSLLLAVVGGSASGKTRLAQTLSQTYTRLDAYVIAEDDYYVDAGNMPGFDPTQFNFDEPGAKDHDLLETHLAALRRGEPVASPLYDFTTHCRRPDTRTHDPAGVIIVEGLHLLSRSSMTELFDLTVFVHACDTTRMNRRMERDVRERGRSPDFVRDQFERIVRPMHDAHVEPQKDRAHIVIENMGTPDFDTMAQPVVERIDALLAPRRTA